MIDVADGKLVLRVGEDELTVTIPAALKQSLNADDSCYAIDCVDMSVMSSMQELLSGDLLEFSLTATGGEECENFEVQNVIAQLNACEEVVCRRGLEKIGSSEEGRLEPSIEEPPELELK